MEETTEKKKLDKKEVIKEIFSWIRVIVFAFLVALILNKFVIVNANVPTGSMESTIQPGDRLIGFRLSYLMNEPRRGDIIIFDYPVNPEEIYIKRIIGLPGETIEIREAKVYIDGSETPLDETYVKEEWIVENDGLELKIPQGYYFVMGDNRNNSLDGRYWATEAVMTGQASTLEAAIEQKFCFVSEDAILGKAIFRYYPSFTKLNTSPY
nr:signal peptidase I [Lachnospiraceae bacterium]